VVSAKTKGKVTIQLKSHARAKQKASKRATIEE